MAGTNGPSAAVFVSGRVGAEERVPVSATREIPISRSTLLLEGPSAMIRPFYRFRSADALLGERAELDSQEIYFASPAELNDPMEGFKHLYWQGDEIVWRNLIRHYVLCLFKTVAVIDIAGADFDKSRDCQFAHHIDADLPQGSDAMKKYSAICDNILLNDAVREFIGMLSTTAAKVRRDELRFYLSVLEPFVVIRATEMLGNPGKGLDGGPPGRAIEANLFEFLRDTIRLRSDHPELAETQFANATIETMQLALIRDISNDFTPTQKARSFLDLKFNDLYIQSLESLVHPDWYAACFVDDVSNAAMWASYADGHKGMCLMFSADVTPSGDASLSLYQAVGVRASKGDVRTDYDARPLLFEAVRYGDDYREIGFFETLGTVPRNRLSFWYDGPDGKHSKSQAQVFENLAEWRGQYWRDYRAGMVIKTSDWAHEREHRLIVDTNISQPRTLKYRFRDLTGICFGVKALREDKLRVMRIIKKKCVEERRTNFAFYQARFSHRTKKIEMVPLSLLTPIP